MIHSLLELFRDGAWQAVGVALTLAAIFASFWIYVLQRKYKELAFGTLSNRPLLAIDDEITKCVTILLDNEPVEHISLVVLGLRNSGNMPILEQDFIRPFAISFGDKAQVLSAEISNQIPKNLDARIDIRCIADYNRTASTQLSGHAGHSSAGFISTTASLHRRPAY